MATRNIGALVVVENGNMIGLFSEREYAPKTALQGKVSKDTHVREIMNRRVVCVASDLDPDTRMALITEMPTWHLPVVANERLAGIVSIGDVVKTIIERQKFTIEQRQHCITDA